MDLSFFTLFAAGFGTFFTPCILPVLPIYMAILLGAKQKQDSRRASILPAFGFILGFSAVFTLLGLGASTIGALLVNQKVLFTLIAGVLIFIFGLQFLGVIRFGFLDRDTRYQGDFKKTRFQTLNAFLLGFFFAFGWTPCVGPILGTVLSWTAINTNSPLAGALYLWVFSMGFAVPMILAAVFTTQTQKLFDRVKPKLPIFEKALGAIMILLALTLFSEVIKPLTVKNVDTPPAAITVPVDAALAPQIGPKPTFIEFYSSYCGACRAVAPTVKTVVDSCKGQHVDIQLLNVQQPANQKLAMKHKVRAVPTFIFLDPKGKEVSRLLGVQTEQTLRNNLTAVMGQKCRI